MKICPQCSWENDDDFSFCLGCGYNLSNESEPSSQEENHSKAVASTPPNSQDCPQCGAKVPIGNLFCGVCGFRMEQHAPSPPQPNKTNAGSSAPTNQTSRSSPSAKLVLLLPNGQEGGTYPLKPDLTQIGRTKGNILFLDDPYVSPLHATFQWNSSGQLRVRDEGSVNGLFIRLKERTTLSNNDILLLGKQLLRFETLAPGEILSTKPLNVKAPEPTLKWGSPNTSYWGRLIQIISGGGVGNSILLGGQEIDMGREQGQLTFPGDRFISGLHARVSHNDGKFYAEDLGSRNGTFIRLNEEFTLKHEDILIVGEQLLRLEIEA